MSEQVTTAALVTAPARGGIAVIVLSGSGRDGILRRVFRPRGDLPAEGGRGPQSRGIGFGVPLSLGWIVTPDATEERVDEAVVVLENRGRYPIFKVRKSGNRVASPILPRAEINIHGGPHVARRVLALLKDCGARVLSGAVDDPTLAQPAPGLDNPAIAEEMLQALRLAGTPLAASAVTQQWSAGLSALAQSLLTEASPQQAAPAAGRLRSAAEALPLMTRLLHPAEVVIAGPPNAGKSSLANALMGRDVSIVSETPGTTRDWVRHLADADGVPVWLTDTAGLWDIGAAGCPAGAEGDPKRGTSRLGTPSVDAEAVRRAWQRVETADLIICVISEVAAANGPLVAKLRNRANVINVSSKSDVCPPLPGTDGDPKRPVRDVPLGRLGTPLAVSARTLAGVSELRRLIRRRLGLAEFDPTAAMAFTDRQARLLQAAADAAERGEMPACRAGLQALTRGGSPKPIRRLWGPR